VLPDLNLQRRARVDATSRRGERAASNPDVEPQSDRIFLRRLQEGKFKTKLTVEHPYLMPPSVSTPEQTLDLTRGNVAELHVAFRPDSGGLVEVRGEGKAARLTPQEG
jgi:hypothetical protein